MHLEEITRRGTHDSCVQIPPAGPDRPSETQRRVAAEIVLSSVIGAMTGSICGIRFNEPARTLIYAMCTLVNSVPESFQGFYGPINQAYVAWLLSVVAGAVFGALFCGVIRLLTQHFPISDHRDSRWHEQTP